MNKTSNSWLSRTSNRPGGFRVMIKQRHNSKQRAIEPERVSFSQLAQSEHIEWQPKDRRQNYTQIKNYVRNHMKTEQAQVLALTKSSRFQKKPKIISNKPSVARKSTRYRTEQDRKEEELNVSRILNKIGKEDSQRSHTSIVKDEQRITLDVLQKKIEDLLDKRLVVCIDRSRTRDSQLQLQLQSMIDKLKNLRKEDPETIQTDIVYFDRKIKLLERLMAEGMTEAEILKKSYLSKLTNRSKHQRYNTEHYTPARKLSMHRYCESALKSAVINSTITRDVYQAPEQSAYNIYRYTNTFFNADRHKQPLPRSSYNREFLVNPKSQDKMIVPKDNEFMGKTNSAKFLNSSYRLDFSPKKAEKINCKDLDACKNKIKSLAVVYDRKQRLSLSPNSYNVFLSKLRASGDRHKTVIEKQQMLPPKKLISQSRRQFKKSEGLPLHSEIKHENLYKLKYQYLKNLKV